MEYELYCDNKILEANILSFGMMGQIAGTIIAMLIQIPPNKMTSVFFFIQFTCGSILFYINFA